MCIAGSNGEAGLALDTVSVPDVSLDATMCVIFHLPLVINTLTTTTSILADEMGLGKTIQVGITFITVNPAQFSLCLTSDVMLALRRPAFCSV